MRQDLPATPARILIRALRLRLPTTVTVEDLYSHPIAQSPLSSTRLAEEESEAA